MNRGILENIDKGACVDISGNITVTGSGSNVHIGGIAAQAGSDNTISQIDATVNASVRAHDSSIGIATAFAGGEVGSYNARLGRNNNSLIQIGVSVDVRASASAGPSAAGDGVAVATAGGGGGQLSGNNSNLTQIGVSISACASACASAMSTALAGGGGGDIIGDNNALTQTNVTINAAANATTNANAGGGIGQIKGNKNTLTQTAVNITAKGKNAGSAFGRLVRGDITLRLYSGTAGGMAVCGSISNTTRAQVHGFIDTAGYDADATSCEQTGGNFTMLNTTRRDDWDTVHRQFCGDADCQQTTCHSPHEQLLTLAEGPKKAVYLISEQRYPFRTEESDSKGLIRISRLERNGRELIPDPGFGSYGNGSLLLEMPDAVNRSILRRLPVSQTVSEDYLTSLYSLPDRQQGALLVRFPLGKNSPEAGAAELNNLAGFPIRLEQSPDGDIIWMQEKNDNSSEIKRYLFNGTRVAEIQTYDLELSCYYDAPVVAAGHDDIHLYTARRVATRIVLERYELNSGGRDYRWESSIEAPENRTDGERYDMSVSTQQEEGQLQIELRPLGTVPASENGTNSSAMALRIIPPEFGGCAERESFPAEVIFADRLLPLANSTMAPACLQKPATPSGKPDTPHSSCPPLCRGFIGAGLTVGSIAATGCTCASCIRKRKQVGATLNNLKKGYKKNWKKQQKEKQQSKFDMELSDPGTTAFDQEVRL